MTYHCQQVPRSQTGSSSSTQSASSSSTKPSNPKPVQNVKAVPPQQPAAPPPGNTSSAGDLIGLGRFLCHLQSTFIGCYIISVHLTDPLL